MNINQFLKENHGSLRYGAPMGRRAFLDDPAATCCLQKVILTEGYDPGGHYFGAPDFRFNVPYLYCAANPEATAWLFVRAWTRHEAKELLLKEYPQLKFKR